MNKVKPPRKWKFINIELEIDGSIVEQVVAAHYTFDSMYKSLRRKGQNQRLPWAIFISRSTYKNHWVKNPDYYNRDRYGRFIKTKTL